VDFLLTRKSTFFRKLVSSYLQKNLHIAFENTQYMRKNTKLSLKNKMGQFVKYLPVLRNTRYALITRIRRSLRVITNIHNYELS
jgi:hypothetical protein